MLLFSSFFFNVMIMNFIIMDHMDEVYFLFIVSYYQMNMLLWNIPLLMGIWAACNLDYYK